MRMKRYIIGVLSLILLYLALRTLYYSFGVYIDLRPDRATETFVKTEGKTILMDRGEGFEPFELRGVDLGSGEPGAWSTDYAVDYNSYYRWFGLIQEMGLNTIRVYSVQEDIFYNAFYDYNTDREAAGLEPLWLLHGVWVNDYAQFSHMDFYDESFLNTFIHDCKAMVDVIHGRRDLTLGRLASSGSGTYRKDISSWVIGYILGVEWEHDFVQYTDQMEPDRSSYQGRYMYTTQDATPFEAGLCRVGDETIRYETERYHVQRLVAFSNWPTTDPFKYSPVLTAFWFKLAAVNVEHIRWTEDFLAGSFASYHVYPYFPDYLESAAKEELLSEAALREMDSFSGFLKLKYRVENWNAPRIEDYVRAGDYTDHYGRRNTYRAYLAALARYHSIPVIIAEYGVTTGRGMAQLDENTGRNQGFMSEQEQGQALIECYEDIMDSGCAGCCLFSWQDEWFKRTWNTKYTVDLRRTPYWSDCQTNEQFFGVLTFDPGEETSVCYVDGDVSEWSEDDLVLENGGMRLSVKYDERYLYFMVEKPGLDLSRDRIYIPLDTTPKSGSNYCENYGIAFACDADFLIRLHGRNSSRVLVQERYESLRSTYAQEIYGYNTYVKDNIPERDSPKFVPINFALKLKTELYLTQEETKTVHAMYYETGRLRYGNANPESPDFDSLADYIAEGDFVEVKIPWQLLNFSDPSRMNIHDDYYENYGIDYIHIDSLEVGLTDGKETRRCPVAAVELKGWGNHVTSHERLKRSYYILKDYWTGLE